MITHDYTPTTIPRHVCIVLGRVWRVLFYVWIMEFVNALLGHVFILFVFFVFSGVVRIGWVLAIIYALP